MEKKLFILALFIWSISQVFAQCSFTPVISPSNVMLCPNEQETLTTGVFDSYQWHKDGQLIPGAISQTYVVDQYMDSGSEFSVAATLAGCTEMSAPVLIDGYVFMLPYLISGGNFSTGPNGEAMACKGDTFYLELGPSVYDTNIEWYNYGTIIPGQSGQILAITQPGEYSVTASTSMCPNFSSNPGVEVVVVFIGPEPVIDFIGGELTETQLLGSFQYQWYLDNILIANATASSHTPTQPGFYTLVATDGYNCEAKSNAYHVISIGIRETGKALLNLFPNPAKGFIQINNPFSNGIIVSVLNGQGESVCEKQLNPGPNYLSIENLAPGFYIVTIKNGSEMVKMEKLIIN